MSRWLSRDLLEEFTGSNPYVYVVNSPAMLIDPSGLFHIPFTNFCGAGYSNGNSGYGEDDPDYPRPGDPRRTGPVSSILSPLDACCLTHDDCMNDAHHLADAAARTKARKCCHRQLVGCAAKSAVSHPWLAPRLAIFAIPFGVLSVVSGPGTFTPPATPQNAQQ